MRRLAVLIPALFKEVASGRWKIEPRGPRLVPSQPAYGRIAQSQFHQTKTRDNQVAARDSYRGHVLTFGDVRCDTPVQ